MYNVSLSPKYIGVRKYYNRLFLDIMSNCRRDGGYCINPYTMAAGEQETEGGAAPAGGAGGAGGRGRGGRRGRGGPPARQRPRVDFWGVIFENCVSWDYDFGCNRQSGICCYNV